MNRSIMKYRWWRSRWQCRLICVLAAMSFFVLSAHAQESIFQAVGGPGGSEFVARCPPGQLLGGVELRADDHHIDAIRPLCRTPSLHVEKRAIQPGDPSYNPSHYDQYEEFKSYYVTDATATTGWYGGAGGSIKTLVCGPGAGGIAEPVVSAIYVDAEGVASISDRLTANRITLLCEGLTYGAPTRSRNLEFWKDIRPDYGNVVNSDDGSVVNFLTIWNYIDKIEGTNICPISQDNLAALAVGIHGRAGGLLDAVGLICDYPKPPPPPVVLGRVQSTTPKGPPMSICDRARDARARNSPVASALEAQCQAARDKLPPVALGRVQPTKPPGQPMSICQRARDARARNSPVAPALEARCSAAGAAGETVPPSAPAITASPNPVLVPNGQVSGTTTITWKPEPDYAYCEIYLSVDNGEWSQFAAGGGGTKPTTIQLGSSYTFRMMVYEGQAGTPKIISTLTLAAKH
jgi:hypothetical protein